MASDNCYTLFQKAYIIHTLVGLIWPKNDAIANNDNEQLDETRKG